MDLRKVLQIIVKQNMKLRIVAALLLAADEAPGGFKAERFRILFDEAVRQARDIFRESMDDED